jgi:hypothetical protein
MRIRERYELAKELAPRYLGARRRERGEILDAFCLTTGTAAAMPCPCSGDTAGGCHRECGRGGPGGMGWSSAERSRSAGRRPTTCALSVSSPSCQPSVAARRH